MLLESCRPEIKIQPHHDTDRRGKYSKCSHLALSPPSFSLLMDARSYISHNGIFIKSLPAGQTPTSLNFRDTTLKQGALGYKFEVWSLTSPWHHRSYFQRLENKRRPRNTWDCVLLFVTSHLNIMCVSLVECPFNLNEPHICDPVFKGLRLRWGLLVFGLGATGTRRSERAQRETDALLSWVL